MESVTYSNGMSRSFGYDRANRVKLVENRANGLSERFEYDYDLNGNRSAERRYREGTLLRALTFGYDLLDRMQTVTDGTRSISYSYDDIGNRLTETGTRLDGTAVSYTYRYDGANRLQDIQDGTGTILASYGHDANGNITSITRGNESWSYDYDVQEQMVRASRTVTQTQPETESGYYSYDFGKRQIGRNWDSDGWTWSVYGQDSVVSEYDAAGSQQNRYEYANGMVVRGEQDGYYFSDAQGSVTFVAGTEPQVTRTEYDPWGVILSGARDGSTISYTGQWRDDQTGLMPLGNGERYYDPLLGRFIQEDSFAGMDTLPQSLNRYAYVHNNPTRFTDPSGHFIVEATVIVGFFVLGLVLNYAAAEERRAEWIRQGLAEEDMPNSWILAASDTVGVTSGYKALVGVDPYTGAELGIAERVLEGVLVGLAVVDVYGVVNVSIRAGTKAAGAIKAWRGKNAGGVQNRALAQSGKLRQGASEIAEGSYTARNGIHPMEGGGAGRQAAGAISGKADEAGRGLRQVADDVPESTVANQADNVGDDLMCPLTFLCFAAGTPVQTRDGQRNIEDLRVGDEVLSYNEQTGQTEYQPITALYAHQNALVLNITVEGEPKPLKVTPEHPFLVYRARSDLSAEESDPDSHPNGEWIEAGHLKVGDQLRTANGTWAAITDIKAGGSVEWAYNFEVAENHSYVVGQNGVVVHNTGDDLCGWSPSEIAGEIREARLSAVAEAEEYGLRVKGQKEYSNYVLTDAKGEIIYVGYADNPGTRIFGHAREKGLVFDRMEVIEQGLLDKRLARNIEGSALYHIDEGNVTVREGRVVASSQGKK